MQQAFKINDVWYLFAGPAQFFQPFCLFIVIAGNYFLSILMSPFKISSALLLTRAFSFREIRNLQGKSFIVLRRI